MNLRDYQIRTIASVQSLWVAGRRAVLVVAPTGAGKTVIGTSIAIEHRPVVWIAHRQELVAQAHRAIAARVGERQVGIVQPGEPARPGAPIQVCSLQTLLARGARPPAELLVLDEAHHYLAEDWRRISEAYSTGRVLGLTATPERGDGKPLGDVFEALVVAATYSELIAAGHLVASRIYRPARQIGNDLAQDPLAAWQSLAAGGQTFGFFPRVEIADAQARRFRAHGFDARVVSFETKRRDRERLVYRFSRGDIRALFCVEALTEGVDVPEASVALVGRAFGTRGSYIQALGRIARPAHGKASATVIDLTGCSHKHGSPTMDREYSLEGEPISGPSLPVAHGGGAPESIEQEILGLPLSEVGGSPATVESVPTTNHGAGQAAFREMLRGHTVAEAMAMYNQKHHAWPKLEWVT